eukprot:GDKI01005446.1.p1 GENE.GDKI01005446.1~~GDKI01005446.1.p1  ORF type:complete len:323 (-),score=74.22 GDKI01005446.1:147-1019(-)
MSVSLPRYVYTPTAPTHFTLNDGKQMPAIGFGCYLVEPGQTALDAAIEALKCGYRHIDTAQLYANERDVGMAIKQVGVKREEVFVTSKVWPTNYGYERAKQSVRDTLQLLDMPYVDLMLLHAPGNDRHKRHEAWRALEDLQAEGLIKSIGVSNFSIAHIQTLMESCKVTPAVNQVEIHPFLARQDLADYCRHEGILIQAYSPLAKAKQMKNKTLIRMAEEYKVTPAQIMIRWCLQKGYSPLPKSVTPSRIRENLDVYRDGFELSQEDVALLDALDAYFVTGWDPIQDHKV